MMTRFREHRGGLAESMETMVYMTTMAELKAHCRQKLWNFDVPENNLRFDEIKVEPYGTHCWPDERIGWLETWIVTMPGYGVLGFTDGEPIRDASP
jgi:hypothetical protein